MSKSTKNNNTRAQCEIIDNISFALVKQFNLFPDARGMLASIHGQCILNTYRQRSSTST